ncbi:MAG: hypothetical protein WED05_05735 [Candidatus Atabeyarchaeum deiterrae]
MKFRWLAWRKRVVVVLFVGVMALLLLLRFFGEAISRALSSVLPSAVSIFAQLIAPTIIASFMIFLVVFVRRGSGLFLRRKRTYNIGGLAISALELLSVPSESVRQRVRGAVSRDEQEDGAAVSDERQYQFSHLASLFEKNGSKRVGNGGGLGYEIHFKNGLIGVDFVVTGQDTEECKRRREQIEASLLSKFPVQLMEVRREHLVDLALMGFVEKANYRGTVEVLAVDNRIAQVVSGGRSRYLGVVALMGRPEMSAHEQRCQIDQFITGINSALRFGRGGEERGEVRFVVSFEASNPPKHPSDASLREKLREKPDVRLSLARKKVEVEAMEIEFGQRVGWWKVSTYVVVVSDSLGLVKQKLESVRSVLRSVWSGSHFSPVSSFLHGKEIVAYLPRIMRRVLLPRRYVTGMSSLRLSSLVHIPEEPHPPLTRMTAPLFEAPDPSVIIGSNHVDVITLGDVLNSTGGALYPLTVPVRVLGTHAVVFGETGSGKTCHIISLLWDMTGGNEANGAENELGSRIPFLVLDQKGEYRCLIRPERGIIYFLPGSRLAPLLINLFDPQGDEPESHAKRIFNIIREILFTNRTELTPQMERVLYDVLSMSIGGDWDKFNANLAEYLTLHGEELPQLGATIQGILNRVGQFTRPPLSQVFNCRESNVNFNHLVQRNAIIDLSELRRQGTPEDVRLLANIIGKYVSVASLNRGPDFSGQLRHLFVVDDALDVVPEVLAKKTTADVGTIEYMAMLLRATGQGLIVVSQRPNIAENVIGNSGVKLFFRTVVDSRDVAAWINLSEEQQAYLKVLPRQEAIIMVPQHPAPMRIRVQDVSTFVSRKVTDRDITVNNMINYPLMYDMWGEEVGRQSSENKLEPSRLHSGENSLLESETVGVKTAEAVLEEECVGKATKGEDGDECEEDKVCRLNADSREAWGKLSPCLADGLAVDSEFVSRILGVSSKVAHRMMLMLKSAGLIVVAKIPNYAYGKGFQYAYYVPKKGTYGSGIVAYVREKIYSEVTSREALAELQPKGMNSADMIIQYMYPLIIQLAGESSSVLSVLRDRIGRAAEEFASTRGRLLSDTGRDIETKVVVVTLWSSIAKKLEEARRRGELGRDCLCVLAFNRRTMSLLADYVLHHIQLGILTGEGEDGADEGKTRLEKDDSSRLEASDEAGSGTGDIENENKRLIRNRVLAVVKESGGIEPHAVAEKLGVRLPRVSEVAKSLRDEGLIKVARNIPFISSLKKSNAVFYLDAARPTVLHDTLMNEIWRWNSELGGRCRDYGFEYGGKTWCTDGLLENRGGSFILEVVAGDYEERIVEQLQAYSGKVGYMGIKGIVVVFLVIDCLVRVREEIAASEIALHNVELLTTLRSREEKLQFKSLLLHGRTMSYHRNHDAIKRS